MKTIALLCVCALALLSSCDKAKDLLDISFNFSLNNDITLPKYADTEYTLTDIPLNITTPSIPNTVPDEFKSHKADINKIKSLTITGITLTIKTPTTQNLGFIKSINLYIGSASLGTKLIATKVAINTINPAPTSLDLTSTNADISEYIKGGSYYLKTEMVIVKTYTADINLGTEVKCKVVANPLN